jgi:hypothetical protein
MDDDDIGELIAADPGSRLLAIDPIHNGIEG